ncbi:MAG: hypothetical protein AAGL10_14190 [Pseudomonadota bacterium]
MFEKASSIVPPAIRDNAAGNIMIGAACGTSDAVSRKGSDALRALDWNELTTRLKAARELRVLLRRDIQEPIGTGAASFGDAAARYFRDELNEAGKEYERPVNLDALEGRKASQSIAANTKGNATTGDARETND